MKNVTSLICLLGILTTYAQEQLIATNYNWQATPQYVMPQNNQEPMLALKEKHVVEFAFNQEDFEEYYVEHKALWLNSNDKIEEYNKIYLPYTASSQLLTSKARVITKAGAVLELDDTKILTATDEQTGRNYKYFALEGVTLGSIVEYFYVEKKLPEYNGVTFRLQSTYPKNNVDFDLYAPKGLEFAIKSYNGIPSVKKDTALTNQNHWQVNIPTIAALNKEEQAPYNASRGFLVYKLDKNLNANKKNISSYANVAQNIYNF